MNKLTLLRNFNKIYALFSPRAFIKFVEKSLITAMDTEIVRRHGK